jgi:hypothetical protein
MMDVYIDASRMPVACRHFQDEEFEGEDWGRQTQNIKHIEFSLIWG